MEIPNEPIRSRVYCPGILRYQVRDLILLPYHAYLSQDFTQRQKHVNFIFLIETDKTRLMLPTHEKKEHQQQQMWGKGLGMKYSNRPLSLTQY